MSSQNPEVQAMRALAERVGVHFADLMFFIRGMREMTGHPFEVVVSWIEKNPEQCKSICQEVGEVGPMLDARRRGLL